MNIVCVSMLAFTHLKRNKGCKRRRWPSKTFASTYEISVEAYRTSCSRLDISRSLWSTQFADRSFRRSTPHHRQSTTQIVLKTSLDVQSPNSVRISSPALERHVTDPSRSVQNSCRQLHWQPLGKKTLRIFVNVKKARHSLSPKQDLA